MQIISLLRSHLSFLYWKCCFLPKDINLFLKKSVLNLHRPLSENLNIEESKYLMVQNSNFIDYFTKCFKDYITICIELNIILYILHENFTLYLFIYYVFIFPSLKGGEVDIHSCKGRNAFQKIFKCTSRMKYILNENELGFESTLAIHY